MRKPAVVFLCVPFLCMVLLGSPCFIRADEDSDIVEKNLFHPDREKWIMESPDENKTVKGTKGKVDDILLSGTIVSGTVKSAVLSISAKRKPGEPSVYMEGDSMSGYLLKEIRERSVVLQDDQSGDDYIIFLNDGKKNRAAVKTEIQEDRKQVSADKANPVPEPEEKKKKIVTTPAETGTLLKDRLQRSLDLLDRNSNRLVLKQAENDYKKLRKLFPNMSASEKKDLREMRKKLNDARQKDKQPDKSED